MAAEKKTAEKVSEKKVKAKAPAAKPSMREKSPEELVIENFEAMSQVVESLGATLELLVQKVESMAHHIIATEEILAELVADNGLNLARVNARIRLKIAAGTKGAGSAAKAIDVAAAIASPLPRR